MSLDSNACVLEKHQVVRHELAFTLHIDELCHVSSSLLKVTGGGGAFIAAWNPMSQLLAI